MSATSAYDFETTDDLVSFLATDEGQALLAEATESELEEIELLLRAELQASSWREDLARPQQLEPGTPGSFSDRVDWLVWAIIAGRGFGKTRSGAEWCAEKADQYPGCRIALVAETLGAGRDDMVEGTSGLLSIIPGHKIARWNRSLGELTLTNRTRMRVFSSERPGALRGPQHHFAWCDETAKWKDAHIGAEDDTTWSNLLFGLRLGIRPLICVTTTPKPVALLKGTKEKPGILFQPGTVISKGSTYHNLANLAPTFRDTVIARYDGTRLGQQELYAELLDDVEGALWTSALIDSHRCDPTYPSGDGGGLWRIVVGVDPSMGDGSKDLCGIVVAGRAADGRVYVLDDCSVAADPDGWAKAVILAFDRWEADLVVAESNQGGELVQTVLRTRAPGLPIRTVPAKRGKFLRAEPISALYQQGKVWHAGRFDELEEQMCFVAGTLVLTDRGHVPIEDVTIADRVWTRAGWAPLKWAGMSGLTSETLKLQHQYGVLESTPCHEIWVESLGRFVRAENVRTSHFLLAEPSPASLEIPSHGEGVGGDGPSRATFRTRKPADFSTALSGNTTSDPSRPALSSITSTMIRGTTGSRISPPSPGMNTSDSTARPGSPPSLRLNDPRQRNRAGYRAPDGASTAPAAGLSSGLRGSERGSVAVVATQRLERPDAVPVFDLSVADGFLPEFFANGVLVHNCIWTDQSNTSPDRLDALGYAIWELSPPTGTIGVHRTKDSSLRHRR